MTIYIGRADQILTGFVIGRTYTLSFDALASVRDGCTVEIGTTQGDDDVLVITTDGYPDAKSYSDTFEAPAQALWIGIEADSTKLSEFCDNKFDNISVAEGEAVEHVTNGTFDSGITGWTDNSSGGVPGCRTLIDWVEEMPVLALTFESS